MAKQKTINKNATVKGTGLHTGRRVTMELRPAPTHTGIVFVRTDQKGAPRVEARPANLKEPKNLQRAILKAKGAEIHTVEHIMAALSGLAIDNIVIEMDNVEVAGLDGSAKEFVGILREAGLHEQEADRAYIEIERPVICRYKDSSIQIVPDDIFRVEYYMDYDHPLLRGQWADIVLDGSEGSAKYFENEIAPARTFHVDTIKKPFNLRFLAGLGMGANFDTTLVIRKDGPVKNTFRFPNEPARHKLLDCIGDLYMFGRHIKGRVTSKKAGHRLNNIFIRRLQEELERAERKRGSYRGRHRGNTEDNAPSLSAALGG